MKHNKIFALFAIPALLLSGCSGSSGTQSSQNLTYTDALFDTVISVQIYDSAEQDVIAGCKELCTQYDQMFSNTNPDSEVSQINQAKGQPVTVSDDTLELLKTGIHYGEISDGAFDITISPVSSLWDFKSEDPELPDSDALAEAVTHVDYKTIQIDGNSVWLADPEAQIDLGAIAKGYIADKLKEYLEGEGIEHAMINLGGNVLAMGTKPDGSEYNIGIQDPFHPDKDPITSVKIADQSVVTSGIYQRYFELDGTRYHHILDPNTGYPYENGLSSVTIVTSSSLTADSLSTTCFALGLEDGLALINQSDGVEALFITDDGELHYSDGFPK